jgi:hypothetical protein|tara:strand:- start:1336 stop:1773 length:438 start_codon:yes stop_codon:yes gene_type:complete
MNEFWQSSPKQRLVIWKQFRRHLINITQEERLQAVVDFWKMAPMSHMSTDIYDSSKWLKPWDYIWHGEYDENSIALGMAYTLHLEEYAQCKILLVQNTKKSTISLVLSVDNMHILNYNYSEVTDIKKLEDDGTVVLDIIDVSTLT